MDSFTIDSWVWGHHVFKNVWTLHLGELVCRREPESIHDRHAVAVVNKNNYAIGHVPRIISSTYSLFLGRKNNIIILVDLLLAEIPQSTKLSSPPNFPAIWYNPKPNITLDTTIMNRVHYNSNVVAWHTHWLPICHMLFTLIICIFNEYTSWYTSVDIVEWAASLHLEKFSKSGMHEPEL